MHVPLVYVWAFGINPPQKQWWPFAQNHMVNSEQCPWCSSIIYLRKTQRASQHNNSMNMGKSIKEFSSVCRRKKLRFGWTTTCILFMCICGTLNEDLIHSGHQFFSVLCMCTYGLRSINNINIWLYSCFENQTLGITTSCHRDWIQQGMTHR